MYLDWSTGTEPAARAELERRIEEAESRANEVIADSEASQLWFGQFGAQWIKENGELDDTFVLYLSVYIYHECTEEIQCFVLLSPSAKVSPDAFIQMALQLAYWRDQGQFSATYETASTRMFAHGRTEVIRTFSTDSRAFVLGMADPSLSVSAVSHMIDGLLQTLTS